MAKAKLVAAISAMRGHSQSILFWLSPNGQVIQTAPRPKTTQTTAQKQAQQAWTQMVKAWANAKAAGERGNWDAFGASNPTTTKCGTSAPLKGFQAFARTNNRLNKMRQPFKLHPPASNTTTAPGAITLTFTPGTPPSLTITPTNNPTANQVPFIKARGPSLAGYLKPSRNFREIAILTAGQVPPWNIEPYYTPFFGNIISGQAITLECFYGDYTTGAYSPTEKQTIVIP